MRSLFAILMLLLGASALSAHPFDDRADMVADVIIERDDDWDRLRLTIQFRYESAYASFNEAVLELDDNRDDSISRDELVNRYNELTADIDEAVVLTVEGERASLIPNPEAFAFVNLDDEDARVDQPGGMTTDGLRIGYFFDFEIRPKTLWTAGNYKVSFHFDSDLIAIYSPREQLRAWDDRGEWRRAVNSVSYDRTSDQNGRRHRINFFWKTKTGVRAGDAAPVVIEDVTDPEGDADSGREQLIQTDEERHDKDSVDSRIWDEFRKLRGGGADLWVWLAVLGMMFVWGAAHALMPGHGKTLVASYLIGTRGTKRDAVFLGIVVTAAHTSGVYLLLGGAWAFRTFWPGVLDDPEKQLSELITLAVGATIFLMGFALVMKRAGGGHHHEHDIFGRHVNPEDDHHGHDHQHPHAHDEKGPEDSDVLAGVPHHHDHGHHHEHGYHHGHGHHHHHEHDPGEMSRWEILRLGILGGVLPCPSAFVIGLIALQQQWYTTGLFLVLAFSLGLGTVLSAIGLVLVQTKSYLHQRQKNPRGRIARFLEARLPMFGALVITLLGTLMVVFALIRLGLVDTATFTV